MTRFYSPAALERRREYTRVWDAAHPDSKRESHLRFRAAHPGYSAAWSRGHPEAKRRQHLRYEYGLTVAEYDAMLDAQGGVCAVCGKPETRVQHGRVDPLAVDHNHETGEARGLLCNNCNVGISRFNDDPHLLLAAVAYLTPKVGW